MTIDFAATSNRLNAEQRKAVETAIRIMEDAGFSMAGSGLKSLLAALAGAAATQALVSDHPDMKQGRWCPDKCPVTGAPFFMWLDHPDLGSVPTYGGPLDSFTIAEPDEDGRFRAERYDHDESSWVEGGHPVRVRCELTVTAEIETDEPAAQKDAVRVDGERKGDDAGQVWIGASEQLPKAEWDRYYHDDLSEPVSVMIEYKGKVRRSDITWRYSFAHDGWVGADLREGYRPGDYADFGRVTHWARLPEPLGTATAAAHLAAEPAAIPPRSMTQENR